MGDNAKHNVYLSPLISHIMARGLQKIEAQQKAAEKAKKGGNSILKKDKGMKFQCSTPQPMNLQAWERPQPQSRARSEPASEACSSCGYHVRWVNHFTIGPR